MKVVYTSRQQEGRRENGRKDPPSLDDRIGLRVDQIYYAV